MSKNVESNLHVEVARTLLTKATSTAPASHTQPPSRELESTHCSFRQEVATGTAEAAPLPRPALDRHKARRHFRRRSCSKAHRWLPAILSERARTALHGKLPMATLKNLRPSHRRDFRPATYLWHTPTLANSKHLVDDTKHRELILGLARASLFSHRHRQSIHVGKWL